MPAQSEKQKTAANMAHAIKKGYIKPKAGTASAEMAKGMTDTQISHFRKEGVDEADGNGAPVSYEDALTKVSQAIVSNGGDASPFDVYTTLASLFGKRLKHVQQELDEKVDEDMGNKEAASMQQEQLKSEQGHIKLSEVLNKMIEGEEEKLGGGAYDREDAEQRGGKKVKCQCGKQFVPSYGEYKRCPSCLSKQHSHGEKTTGVQEGEEEKLGGAAYDREDGRSGHSNKSNMIGITFFNVPSGKESVAKQFGLTQFKSGKWGFKHRFDPRIVSVASDREKSTISAAERALGKGRYWTPQLEEGEEERYNKDDRGAMGAQWRADQQYDKYHTGQKNHLDAKKAKGNVYGSDQIAGGVEDKADLAKMSPEDQKKAMICLNFFEAAKKIGVSSDQIIDFAVDLEAINKKYGTNVGNTNRK